RGARRESLPADRVHGSGPRGGGPIAPTAALRRWRLCCPRYGWGPRQLTPPRARTSTPGTAGGKEHGHEDRELYRKHLWVEEHYGVRIHRGCAGQSLQPLEPAPSMTTANIGLISTMPTEYEARILKLDLSEQDALKNDPERCSADPSMLESIGRAVKHQVRIKRADDARFVALYTVSVANPQADLSNPSRANVVRTAQAGRERLGTPDEMKAVVQATVVDTAPPRDGVRCFEVAIDDRTQAYFIAIAPHGGAIEPRTDDEAKASE
ncbi:MAG: hypothetical protein LC775_12890, partial [Acidobacteria bacterium]|nr:hypothetical protein [Acidobacteriota bacterium]